MKYFYSKGKEGKNESRLVLMEWNKALPGTTSKKRDAIMKGESKKIGMYQTLYKKLASELRELVIWVIRGKK